RSASRRFASAQRHCKADAKRPPATTSPVTTTGGNGMTDVLSPVLGEATLQELREAVSGEVVSRTDEGYDAARLIWNGAHDAARPAVVVRCTSADDVAAAIGFARSQGLSVAVRGGGHSVAGFSTID